MVTIKQLVGCRSAFWNAVKADIWVLTIKQLSVVLWWGGVKMTSKDGWPLSEGNIVADLQRWKSIYIQSLSVKRYAPRTLTIYSRAIDELIEYSRKFMEEITISDIGTFFITQFLDDKAVLAKNGISDTTRSHYIRIFKTFIRFVDEFNSDSFGILNNFRNLKIRNQNGQKKKKPAYT